MLRGKLIGINACIKQEISQINHLNLHLKKLEKEQTKPKASRKKKIIKIRSEIHKIENKKTIGKINESKSWFLKRSTKLTNIYLD